LSAMETHNLALAARDDHNLHRYLSSRVQNMSTSLGERQTSLPGLALAIHDRPVPAHYSLLECCSKEAPVACRSSQDH